MSDLFLPIVANWSAPVRETYSYLTEIFETRSGKEQRRANRVNPRRDLSVNFLVANTSAQALHAALNKRDETSMEMADFSAAPMTLAQPAAAGAISLTVDIIQPWLASGQGLALVERLSATRVSVISTAGATLTVAALDRAFPAGTAIYPLISGRLSQSTSMQYETASVARGTGVFRQTRGSAFDSQTTPPQFAGDDLFDFVPNWVNRPVATFFASEEEVDYNKGVTQTFKPIDFNSRRLQFNYLGMKRSEVERIRDFYFRQKGRRGEFWCPSFIRDMEPTIGVNAGDTGVRVLGTDIPAAFNDTVHQAICVIFTDGSKHLSKIVGIVVETAPIGPPIVGDFNDDFNEDYTKSYGLLGQQTYIEIETPFPAAKKKNEIASVCWLYKSRFATDDLTVEWVTSTVAGIVVNVTSLEGL